MLAQHRQSDTVSEREFFFKRRRKLTGSYWFGSKSQLTGATSLNVAYRMRRKWTRNDSPKERGLILLITRGLIPCPSISFSRLIFSLTFSHSFLLRFLYLFLYYTIYCPDPGVNNCRWSVTNKPAMLALLKVLRAPVNMALIATRDTSPLRCGASWDKTPIWLPREPMLAKPHRAYVAMRRERGDRSA